MEDKLALQLTYSITGTCTYDHSFRNYHDDKEKFSRSWKLLEGLPRRGGSEWFLFIHSFIYSFIYLFIYLFTRFVNGGRD